MSRQTATIESLPQASIATTQGARVARRSVNFAHVSPEDTISTNPVQPENTSCCSNTDDRSVSLHLRTSGLPVKRLLFPMGTLRPSAREGLTRLQEQALRMTFTMNQCSITFQWPVRNPSTKPRNPTYRASFNRSAVRMARASATLCPISRLTMM